MARLAARSLAGLQAGYLVLTGIAPIVAMPVFERLTGPKRDDWLVQTVGALAIAWAAVLGRDAARGPADPVTGIAAAAPFAASSAWFVARGTVRRIYLVDAAIELAFIGAWLAALVWGGGRPGRRGR